MRLLKRLFSMFIWLNIIAVICFLGKLACSYDLVSVFHGMKIAREKKDELIDISHSGKKYVALKTKSNEKKFDQLLEAKGYKHIAKYGKSDVYMLDGVERLIKRSVIFGKFFLFELF